MQTFSKLDAPNRARLLLRILLLKPVRKWEQLLDRRCANYYFPFFYLYISLYVFILCRISVLQVGYFIRFSDCTSNKTKLKFMTDEMLLHEFIGQPSLEDYSVIYLDSQERTLYMDAIFGLVSLKVKFIAHNLTFF